jgi:hypothetical protein
VSFVIRKNHASRDPPTAPPSLPKYLPKQDTETLSDTREYLDKLIEWKQRPIDEDDLPEAAEPVDDESAERTGTVVMEKVTCGDETCKCMTDGEKHGPYKYQYYRKSDGTLTPSISTTNEFRSTVSRLLPCLV